MKKIFVSAAMLCCLHCVAQNKLAIVPAPVEVGPAKAGFDITDETFIVAGTAEETKAASVLNEFLRRNGYKELRVSSTAQKIDNCISLLISKQSDRAESYSINSEEQLLSIVGNDAAGLFYGLQTFLQLIPSANKSTGQKNYPLSIPSLSIKDYPRFPYRGMHFDVARHFSSVEYVKKYIDYLAIYKFNTFHWHLTDDQGWRIEIKKYPLLTQVGGCRAQTLVGPYGTNKYDGKKYCGFYTQEQIREVVKYAAARHINVIPEIEMPGHALAALASYPSLGCTKGPYKTAETWGVFDDVFCAGNDSTFTFLQNVLDEVLELFPSKMIHIGGDESPKTKWKTCIDCQRRIKTEHLKDEHELQSYFIRRIEKYLNSKGRNIIGWDEILEGGLAPNAAVMSWRGEEGGITAAKQHHYVVMTPGNYLYFDHAQGKNEDSITFGGYNSLEKVYSYEPVPAALTPVEARYILGAQANLWTEYISNPKKVEYQLFPRIAALSEVLWSPKEKRNWEDFERRLPTVFDRNERMGINYSKAYYEPSITLGPAANDKGIRLTVSTKEPTASFYFGNKNKSRYQLIPDSISTVITQSGLYGIRMLGKARTGAGEQWGTARVPAVDYLFKADLPLHFNLATGKKTTLLNVPFNSYAGCGGFTLVDGVHNTTGMSKSSQFLGFAGEDLDATTDLGSVQKIKGVSLRAFEQTASWIYRPAFVSFYASVNGKDFTLMGTVLNATAERHPVFTLDKKIVARYIRVVAKNAGTIAAGNPGEGNKAWLFVDEIIIN